MATLTISGPDKKVLQIMKELKVRARKTGIELKLAGKRGPKPKEAAKKEPKKKE